MSKAIDGQPETAWGIYPEVGRSHSAVFVLDEPLADRRPRAAVGRARATARPRPSDRPAADCRRRPPPIPARHAPTPDGAARRCWPSRRPSEPSAQRAELTRSLLTWQIDGELAALPPPQDRLRRGARFQSRRAIFIPAAKPREVHVLRRGDINQPMAGRRPAHCSCIAGLEGRFALDDPDDEGSRRAALARWLVDAAKRAHLALDRQPRLALPFRPRDRRHAERLGPHGRAAVASRTARLAGGRIPRRRRLAQETASADRHQRHLPPIVADRSAARPARRRESAAVADEPLAARCRNASATPSCKSAASST